MGEYAMGMCGAGVKRVGLATRNDTRMANECVAREGREDSNQGSGAVSQGWVLESNVGGE